LKGTKNFVRDREKLEIEKFEIEIKSAYRLHKCPRDRAFCSR